jgi:hypothetical protein
MPVMSHVQRYRTRYRQRFLPQHYSGPIHVVGVYLIAAIGVAVLLTFGPHWSWHDTWIVPVTVLIANVVEYAAHRGPMHHRTRWLPALHHRHTCRHHRYFRPGEMHFESTRDFHAVLFPPALLLFFGAVTGLIGTLVALFLPAAVATLFVATSLTYYALYETLHFLYHVPPTWRAGRLPGVAYLARLHHLHHDPRRMQAANFNLVFPLMDWVLGTLDEGVERAPRLTSARPRPRMP